MTHSTDLSDARLLTLLTRQRDLYAKLRELSTRQRDLICGEQPEHVLGILQDRQMLVTALTQLNDELAPFRRTWDETYTRLADPIRKQAAALLAEISSLLSAILHTDQEDGALLAARKQLVARELEEVGATQSAANAYNRASAARPTLSADLAG